MSGVTRLGCCSQWLGDDVDLPGDSECAVAMRAAHAFLHGELPDDAGDEIREHLMACEACMDYYQAEEMITALLRRCSPPARASRVLRVRVQSLHIETGTEAA